MQNKAIKITVGVLVSLLSLSTTAYAGYKAINKNEAKVLGITSTPSPTATPEIIEQIEEVIEFDETKPSPTSTIVSTTAKPEVTLSGQVSVSATIKSFFRKDDDDDEVEFEDHEDEVEDKKDEDR